MKEELILKLFEKFEKGSSVVMHIKEGDTELLLKKEGAFPESKALPAAGGSPVQNFFPAQFSAVPPVAAQDACVQQPAQQHGISQAASDTSTDSVAPADDKNLVFVKSPIVGTFYRAPSPDSPPYVEKGATVKKGQPLCVLEAMKMMNTLECEYDGIIEDILAANGDLVEFDQPVFAIRVK